MKTAGVSTQWVGLNVEKSSDVKNEVMYRKRLYNKFYCTVSLLYVFELHALVFNISIPNGL